MEVKEMNIVAETTVSTVPTATLSTTMTNPTVAITQVASKEYLKILELAEYCRIAQFTLRECENKIQVLVTAKNDIARLKMEYLTRDKINITNHESLLQAKNELFQYKSELKSKYVAIEKAAKTKKLQYEKLISTYESDWQKTLGEYKSNILVTELNNIQQTNFFFEKNIEIQEKLTSSTKIQLLELQKSIKKKFLNKIVEFSTAVMEYKKFILLQKVHRARKEAESSLTPEGSKHIKFSKSVIPAFAKDKFFCGDTSSFPGIDVSVFDELMVPTENLETQNEEEELFNIIKDQNMQMDDDNADQEERAEMDDNIYHKSEEQGETQMNTGMSIKQNVEGEENESQYFRTQGSESLKQRAVQNTTADNSNTEKVNDSNKNKNSALSTGTSKENNEKICNEETPEINGQNESEKSISEASYENQNIYLRESFEYMYNKTHSVSSEDMPMSGDNTNESFGSPHKIMNIEQTDIFKLQDDQEREEAKSFGDFFTMNDEKTSAKPSIFKLF